MEHFIKTIEALNEKLSEQERAVYKTKAMINDLCELAGQPIQFPNLSEASDSIGAHKKARSIDARIKSDDFFGKPLSSCIRSVLEMRKAVGNGPTDVKEIYRLLNLGGYEFNTKDPQNAMTGLWVSISKNSATFVKLPSGLVGLTDWYPDKPRARVKLRDRDSGSSNGDTGSPAGQTEDDPETVVSDTAESNNSGEDLV